MTEPEVFYLIQRKSDGYFAHPVYEINGQPNWINTKIGAEWFTSELRAKEFVQEHNLQDVEIVPFVSIPLSEYQQLKK